MASTNHLDQLDPGLSSRPSRFDRKYLFPLPSNEERVLYCQYWREKLKNKPAIKFPKKLCPAIAGITQEFSFAYLKEAFVATLLTIARRRSDFVARRGGDDEDGDLDDYELWREMKKTVKALREDMGTRNKGTAFGHVLGANGVSTPQFQSLGSSIRPSSGHDASASSATPTQHGLALRGRVERHPPASFEYQHAGTPSDHAWSAMPLISDDGKLLNRNVPGLNCPIGSI